MVGAQRSEANPVRPYHILSPGMVRQPASRHSTSWKTPLQNPQIRCPIFTQYTLNIHRKDKECALFIFPNSLVTGHDHLSSYVLPIQTQSPDCWLYQGDHKLQPTYPFASPALHT